MKFHCKLISLSLLIHWCTCLFLTTTSVQQHSIVAKNNINVPLITDDCLLFVTKTCFKDRLGEILIRNIYANTLDNHSKSLNYPKLTFKTAFDD